MSPNSLLAVIIILSIAVTLLTVIAFVMIIKNVTAVKEPKEADNPEDEPLLTMDIEQFGSEERIELDSDGKTISADVRFSGEEEKAPTTLDDFNGIGSDAPMDLFGDEGETTLLSGAERISVFGEEEAEPESPLDSMPLFADDEIIGTRHTQSAPSIFYSDDEGTTSNLAIPVGELPVAYFYRIATDERIEITKAEFSLGKSQNADYTVKGNNTISRVHVVIIYKDGEFNAVDNHSSNHTYLNEMTLEPDHMYPLKEGDKVVLSSEVFTFHKSE